MRLTVVRSQATPLGSDSIHKTCEEKKDTLPNLSRTATSKTPSEPHTRTLRGCKWGVSLPPPPLPTLDVVDYATMV